MPYVLKLAFGCQHVESHDEQPNLTERDLGIKDIKVVLLALLKVGWAVYVWCHHAEMSKSQKTQIVQESFQLRDRHVVQG